MMGVLAIAALLFMLQLLLSLSFLLLQGRRCLLPSALKHKAFSLEISYQK
jgi:hypothetical protein